MAAPFVEDMPVGDLVEVLLMSLVMEAIMGVLYMAVLISRLVAVYSSTQAAPRESFPPGQT